MERRDMRMRTLLVAGALALAVAVCQAQTSDPARNADKGTYLGLLFAPITDVLAKKVPQLPPGQGVRVTQVLADSPASKAELKRDDLVLAYNGKKIRDCEHFARLIIEDKPKNKVKLDILRDGEKKTVEATLAEGPALRITSNKAANTTNDTPKATAKPGGPNSVSVTATPLDEGKMKVTIEFYKEGKIINPPLEASGTPAEIDRDIDKKVEEPHQRTAIHEALARIRKLTNPKPADDKKP
jgi:hypothetical protein